MKRMFVCAAALALILCLANGAAADVDMDMSSFDKTIYVWDGLENGEIQPVPVLVEASVHNFNEMSGAYGGYPTWSFQQTSGPDIGLYAASTEHSEWLFLSAMVRNFPKNDCVITVAVTCAWAGQTKQEEVTIQFVKVDPPLGVTIPKVVDLQAGQSLTLTGGFLPSGWPSGENVGGAYVSINGFEDASGVLVERVSEDCWTITGVTPGVYAGSAYISIQTVMCDQDLIVQVRDENGNLPKPTVSLSPLNVPEILFWPGAQVGTENSSMGMAYLEDTFWPVSIEGTDAIRAQAVENPPVWSAEIVSGPQFQFAPLEVGGAGNKANLECKLRITAVPTQPGDTVVRFTCEFLDQTVQQDVTFRFVQIPEPTGVDFPDVVTMEVGETRILSCDFLPAGAYDGYGSTAYFPVDFHNSGLFMRDWNYPIDSGVSLTALSAGEFTCWTGFVMADTVHLDRNVTYRATPPSAAGKTVCLPAGTKTVEASAFEGTAMKTLVLPQGISSIGSRAFAGCGSLRKVIAPDSLTEIAEDAFAGCSSVTFYTPFRALTVAQFARDHGFGLVQY